MQLLDSIYARRSIRGFLDQPVSRPMIEQLLRISQRTMSGMNVQPWKFHIVTGDKLEQLKKANIDGQRNYKGAFVGADLQGVYRERQVTIAKRLLESMGIGKEDKAARAGWAERGFRYFDAPAALILTVETGMHEHTAYFAIGSFCQTFCMAALEFGLGTCVESQGIFFQEAVRGILGIGAEENMIICIAFGYPDWSFPANHVISDREKLENVAVWHS